MVNTDGDGAADVKVLTVRWYEWILSSRAMISLLRPNALE